MCLAIGLWNNPVLCDKLKTEWIFLVKNSSAKQKQM
jgi:hypothetical protein